MKLLKYYYKTGVDFTSVSRAAFVLADPKSTKRHRWLDCLFALLVSLHVKAYCKYVGEIDPRTGPKQELNSATEGKWKRELVSLEAVSASVNSSNLYVSQIFTLSLGKETR